MVWELCKGNLHKKYKRKQLQRADKLTGNYDQSLSAKASSLVFVTGGFCQSLKAQFESFAYYIFLYNLPFHILNTTVLTPESFLYIFHKNGGDFFCICTKLIKRSCRRYGNMLYFSYGNVTGSVADTVTGTVYIDGSEKEERIICMWNP